MNKPLDELYFEWLYSQVASTRLRNPSRTYWKLLRQLYTTEFVWLISNDDNRQEDGIDLREEFFDTHPRVRFDKSWSDLPCSMLEMIVAMSRRLSFETEREPRDWFWEMLDNLEISDFNDAGYFEAEESLVTEVLNRVIYRQYNKDGSGGLFPLRHPTKDQRKVELCYQYSEYLYENE